MLRPPAYPRRLQAALALGLALAGAALVVDALWLQAKAALAQSLLRRSWAAADRGAAPLAPWPRADTYAVGRLVVASLAVDQVVLAGASGRTLAFGPAHVAPSAAPGEAGHVVLSGHRDTHFAFLGSLVPGERIRLAGRGGAARTYRVTGSEVIDVRRGPLALDPRRDRLSLATCLPFGEVAPGTPLRYVVHAVADGPRWADPP